MFGIISNSLVFYQTLKSLFDLFGNHSTNLKTSTSLKTNTNLKTSTNLKTYAKWCLTLIIYCRQFEGKRFETQKSHLEHMTPREAKNDGKSVRIEAIRWKQITCLIFSQKL